MAQITPVPYPSHIFALRQDLNSLLGAGHSFFNSLLSPDSTAKSNGKATSPVATASVGGTTESTSLIAPPVGAMPTQNLQTTTLGVTTTGTSFSTLASTAAQSQLSITSELNPSTPSASSSSHLSPPTSHLSAAPSASSNTHSFYPASQLSAAPSASSNSYLFSPTSGLSAASSTSTPNIAASSALPPLPKHSSKAGPIAAAVTIVVVLSLSIAILAFIYIRRRRKLEQTVGKSTSRSPSLLTISSDYLAVESIEEPKAILRPLSSQPTVSQATVAMPPPHLNDWSRLGSGTASPFRSHQGLNTASSGPKIPEPVPQNTECEPSHLEPEIMPGKRNDLSLPPALIAGRGHTSESPTYSGFSSHELRISSQGPKRSLDRPGPGQVFFPAGVTSPSTRSEDRNAVRRKPVPKRNVVDAGA